MTVDNQARTELAKKALTGVSLGDAFGESFFGDTDSILSCIKKKEIPRSAWEFTDDTVMSIAVFNEIKKGEGIVQDRLIHSFIENHDLDPNRGYGATVRRVLREVHAGATWKKVAPSVFDGMGSMGNGSAMRAHTIGAYYYDDLDLATLFAEESSVVTHSHIEAIAGAIAVSIASALSTKIGLGLLDLTPMEFIAEVRDRVPNSDLKAKINKSLSVSYGYGRETLISILGNGSQMLAKDTVPFAIWCAAYDLKDFESAMWKAVSVLGDRDTICAIVGGIVIMSANAESIPRNWLDSVENFETSPFYQLGIQ